VFEGFVLFFEVPLSYRLCHSAGDLDIFGCHIDVPGFIEVQGQDALEKIFWALSFGEWLSYHLAMFYGIDPTPVEMVEELKNG